MGPLTLSSLSKIVLLYRSVLHKLAWNLYLPHLYCHSHMVMSRLNFWCNKINCDCIPESVQVKTTPVISVFHDHRPDDFHWTIPVRNAVKDGQRPPSLFKPSRDNPMPGVGNKSLLGYSHLLIAGLLMCSKL